jgi:anhydro-N-acetylmuramic acid kinase
VGPRGRARRGDRAAHPDGLLVLRDYPHRTHALVIGVMTGTSADAVDTALVRFEGAGPDARPRLIAYRETALDPALRREVLEVAAIPKVELERLMRLDVALGELYAASVLELLAISAVDPVTIAGVGLHGQTIRHVPRADGAGQAMSWQLGSASILAERTGLLVVSDFRAADTAAGGEGAPLVPLVDWWLFRSNDEDRVLLNLGGIANLTWLPRGAALENVMAFDTGPGNAVIDAIAERMSDGAHGYDVDGRLAARGRASDALLAELLADEYFARTPPRSTGRERFGAAYADRLLDRARALSLAPEDAIATATELTAAAVADALERFVTPRGAVGAIYGSGGGMKNATLVVALERRLAPAPLRALETLGIESDGKEALAFACLAHRTLCGAAGNVPAATGATHPAVLGRITPGRWA